MYCTAGGILRPGYALGFSLQMMDAAGRPVLETFSLRDGAGAPVRLDRDTGAPFKLTPDLIGAVEAEASAAKLPTETYCRDVLWLVPSA